MLATYSAVLSRPSIFRLATPSSINLGDQVVGGQVLGAQKVLDVVKIHEPAVADDLIRHAARLGAFAPIRRPASQRLAGQALPRIGHAKRTVDEHLQGKVDRPADAADFRQRQLASEDDSRAAELAGELNPFLAGDRHLGRRVDLEIGRDRADQPRQSQILDDHRIDTGLRPGRGP